MAKYKPGDEQFDLPEKLLDLYKRKEYGSYVDQESIFRVNFLTNNNITYGNSNSPVRSAPHKELTGLAFNGNWKGMSANIALEKK
ncbi:MAG: S46 family peptidase [Flavobacteriales bacterium AspAUS03]